MFCNDFVKYLHAMLLGYMRIKIPWKNLSTEQTVIDLDGVYVIIVPYLSMLSIVIFPLYSTVSSCIYLLCSHTQDTKSDAKQSRTEGTNDHKQSVSI